MTIRRLTRTDNNNNVDCLVNIDYFLTYKNCILHLNVKKNKIPYEYSYVHLLQKISIKPRLMNELMNHRKKSNKVNVLRYAMAEPNIELCLEWISMHKIELMQNNP